MILDKEVEITLHNQIYKHYENLGYTIPKYKNEAYKWVVKHGTKIKVKVEDLTNGSKVFVNSKCDMCGRIREISYINYTRKMKIHNRDICHECSEKILPSKKTRKKMSISRSGDKNYWFGKKIPEENIEKQRQTKIKNGSWKTEKERTIYKNYWLKVDKETHKNTKKLFQKWDGKDYYTNENITFLPDRDITIDHKISVYYGFINNIIPEEIGKLENLCITSRKINSMKQRLTEEQFLIKRGK